MPKLINWEILGNPYNWLVIWIVLAGATIAVTMLYASFGTPAQQQ